MDDSPCRRTRRDALRLLGLSALALPAALRHQAASASHGWCQNDPIVKIDGQTADIFLSSYLEMQLQATGPAQIVVTVPPGVPAELVATDPGFGGYGYEVSFAESRKLADTNGVLGVQIEVYAPAQDSPEGPLPLKVEFTPLGNGRLASGSAQGWANKWVTLHAPDPAPPQRALSPGAVDTSTPTVRNQKGKKKGKRGQGKKKRR